MPGRGITEIAVRGIKEVAVAARFRDPAVIDQMTEQEAAELTHRIREAAANLSGLLAEAKRRGAHVALGYPTWEKYVEEAFGFSRQRSYQLLHHDRVVREIAEAAGVTTAVVSQLVPERAARDIPDANVPVLAGVIRKDAERLPPPPDGDPDLDDKRWRIVADRVYEERRIHVAPSGTDVFRPALAELVRGARQVLTALEHNSGRLDMLTEAELLVLRDLQAALEATLPPA
jgi:hypothetical protein